MNPPSSTPPPIPQTQIPQAVAEANLRAPVTVSGKVVSGTEGLSVADVEQEVLKGGRFVIYAYNFSVLIMSFKRSSDLRFLRKGQDGALPAAGYTLLSLAVGPWGIPWGIIFTITSFFTNLAGGKDLTLGVLSTLVGPARAAQVMASRVKPTSGMGMMLFRTAAIGTPLALIVMMVAGIMSSAEKDRETAAAPGYKEFKIADSSASASSVNGNNKKAVEVSKLAAARMKDYLEATVSTSKGKPVSSACGVWCDLHDDHCTVIMKVPGLRKFNTESRALLSKIVWTDVLSSLRETQAVKPGTKLAVGVRGDFLYESVLLGEFTEDIKSTPRATLDHSAGKAKLVELFRTDG